jgi:hypothetical protein
MCARRKQQPRQQPNSKGKTIVNWYDYIACFFAGMFLANGVPHFVHGISGDRFPTPFAHPRGKGLSSPTVNVVWALFNLVAGTILFRVGKVSSGDNSALVVFLAGIAALSTMLSVRFAKKHAN